MGEYVNFLEKGEPASCPTGYGELDDVLGGVHPGDLWVHSGRVGEFKSMFVLNWLYNLAVYFKKTSLLVSHEAREENIRRKLVALHVHHSKFDESVDRW